MSRALLLAAAAALAIPVPAAADELRDTVAADLPSLLAIYRDLHQHPELSFEEVRSAKVMADAARKAGFEVTEKVGKTGIIAVLEQSIGSPRWFTSSMATPLSRIPRQRTCGADHIASVISTPDGSNQARSLTPSPRSGRPW